MLELIQSSLADGMPVTAAPGNTGRGRGWSPCRPRGTGGGGGARGGGRLEGRCRCAQARDFLWCRPCQVAAVKTHCAVGGGVSDTVSAL